MTDDVAGLTVLAVPQRSARRRTQALTLPPGPSRPDGPSQFRFYLGTHEPGWLRRSPVPLFVAYPRLVRRPGRLPRSRVPWALDSGGFTELTRHGRWTIEPERYADDVRHIAREVGSMQWAAPQDWMCEPAVLHGGSVSPKERAVGTGRTVAEHQILTALSLIRLRELAPEIHWIPVLQGWAWGDHAKHVDVYRSYGVDLQREPVVGLGSVCRRQSTVRASLIIRWLADEGVRLHGFGFKSSGLPWCARWLDSADSLAWSYRARRGERLAGHQHRDCRNCLPYAVAWRQRVLRQIVNERIGPRRGRIQRLEDEHCLLPSPCRVSQPDCWPCRLYRWRTVGAETEAVQ